MRKTITSLLAAGLLAVPATALAQSSAQAPRHHGHARHVAAQQCRGERATLGIKSFREKYGKPGAFRSCVKAHRPTDRQAAQACRTQRRQEGRAAFRRQYGTPKPLDHCIKAHTAALKGF